VNCPSRTCQRGGGAARLAIDDVGEFPEAREGDLVALSDALSGLATFDARLGQVVELRFLVDSASKRRLMC
jgi:ECF sigma factor